MPKYISGRVKTTPVTGLTSDRYRYLSLADAEPNLGDPLVGPSSIGAKPITSGNKYQLFAVDGYPGERYWQQVQAQQLIPGSISVYEEGSLIGGLSSTTELDFRGTAITAEGLGGINPGYAVTITFAPPGNEKEIIFKESNDFATDATFTFDSSINLLAAGDRITVGTGGTVITTTASGFVGIGTTNPTGDLTTNYDPNLHVEGNIRLTGTIIDRLGDAGQAGFLLVKESDVFGGLSWTDPANVTFGGAGDYRQVQFKGSTGLLEGGDLFYYDEVNNFVGIGSTQPNVRLDVIGASNFDGNVTIEGNLSVDGTSTFTNTSTFNGNIDANGDLDVDGQTDLDVLNVSQLATFSGNIDANGNLDVDGQTDLDVLNVSQLATFSANLDINASVDIQNNLDVGGTLDVTGATDLASAGGITTTGGDLYVGNDLYVAGTFNIVDLEAETGNFTVSLQTVDFRATGISTLGNLKVSGNTVDTTGGNLILQANAQNNAQSIDVRNRIVLNNSTESTAVDNGSFETTGGVGIAKNLNVGGEVSFTGDGSGVDVTLASAGGITTTGGDLYVGGDFYVNQDSNFKNLTVETLTVSVAATIANLTLDNPGIAVTAILDEDNMISNRDDALATQQSIKAYVDTQVGNQDLDFVGDFGTQGAVDLDTQVFDIGGVTGDIKTTSSGQSLTIESDVSGVVAGTYGSATRVGIITVNDKGKITAASDVDIDLSNVTVAAADRLTTPRTISFSEDVVAVGKTFDGTQNVGFALTLTSVFDGGTYGGENNKVLSLTVDDKGRITGITSVAIDFSSVGSAEKVSIATTDGSEEPYFLTFVADTSGAQSVYVGAGLSYYPTTELVDFDSNVRVNINKSFCLGDDTDYATWSYRSGNFAYNSGNVLEGSGTNRYTQDGLLITDTGKASIFEEQGAGPTVFKGLGSGDGAFWFVDNNWSTMLRMQATGSGGANFSFYNAGGSEILQVVGTGLTVGGSVIPTACDTYDLGASDKRWRTVYAENICATNINGTPGGGGGGGDADRVSTGCTTGTGNYFLTFVDSNNTSRSAEDLYTDAEIKYDPDTDTLKPKNLTVGDTSTDTLIVNASVGSTITPDTTNTYDLGSSASLRWKTVYADTICADNYCGAIITGSASAVGIATTIGGQEPYYLTFVATTAGAQPLYTDSGLRYYPATDDLALDSNLLVCDNKTVCVGNSQEFGLTYCVGNFAYDDQGVLGGDAAGNATNALNRYDVSGNLITGAGKGATFEETGNGPVLFRALGSGQGAFQFFSTNSNDVGCSGSLDPEEWVSLLKMHGGRRGFRLFQCDANLEVLNITGAGVTVAGNIVPWVGSNPQESSTVPNACGPFTSGTFDLGSPSRKWNNVYANNFIGSITGNLTGNADTVSTACTTGSGTYYATFVKDNNTSPTAENVYTDGGLVYDPNSNTLNPTNLTVANCLTVDQNARICGCLDVGPATVSINGVTNTITVGTGVVINPTTSCFNNVSVQTITPKTGGTYNLGASGNNFGTIFADNVCATNLYGTFSGSASSASSADQVKTQCNNTNGTYYLTFVDSNNSTATSETEYTTCDIQYFRDTSRKYFRIGTTYVHNRGGSDPNIIIGGTNAGCSLTSGDRNVIIGGNAGQKITTGYGNIAIGPNAGTSPSTTGTGNGTAFTGVNNIMMGYYTGGALNGGNVNVLIGQSAGENVTSGGYNVFLGSRTGGKVNSGSYNTFLGTCAGCTNTGGSYNTFLGVRAGSSANGGNFNVAVGRYSGADALYDIGSNSNKVVIGYNNTNAAYVKVAWTTGSDIRCKCVWGDVPHGREFLRGVNPIKYSFKDEDTNEIVDENIRYGFSAQEILALEGNEPVIASDRNPNLYTVTSDYMIPVLVNAIKELDAENTELKQRIVAIEQHLGL